MRSLHHSLIVVGVAFLLVGAAVSTPGQTAIEDTTNVETVGDADALIGAVAGGAVGGYIVGTAACAHVKELQGICGNADTEKIESTDAEQVKIDIYSAASSTHDTAETYLTTQNNHIEDSREIALMEGKNAAIRAYQNESSEIQAEQAARDAIEDYYSRMQIQVIDAWNTSATQFQYLESVAGNESEIESSSQAGWISYNDQGGMGYTDAIYDDGGYHSEQSHGAKYFGTNNVSTTLINGSDQAYRSVDVGVEDGGTSASNVERADVGPQTGTVTHPESEESTTGLIVRSSRIDGGDYDDLTFLDFNEWSSEWDSLTAEESAASDEVVTFVNATYDEWESGAINESDLIDPYLGSREYSPDGDFQSWALSTYSSMGMDSPANLSSFGSMTITSDNDTVDGILMSDGLPESGTFATGETYNTENLTGAQYVIGAEETHEIDGEFTIDSMRDADGNDLNETEYREVTYESANLSQYQEISDELADLRAEIEAEEQDALNPGGGLFGGLPFGLGMGELFILAGGGFLALSALSVVRN